MDIPLEYDPQPIDRHWRELSDLTIYEAAFWMATGDDPLDHKKRCLHDDAYANYFHDRSEVSEAIEERQQVISSAIRCGHIKTTADTQPSHDGSTKRTRILKTDWISWCLDNGYPEIANRFGHVAADATVVPEMVLSSEAWRAQARTIADECFDSDTANNCRDSLARKNSVGQITGGYCLRVMGIMQERGIKGPRGIIGNPATVMRDALQGKKWWANKVK